LIRRVDHVAFAVRSLKESIPKLEKLYGAKYLLTKEVPEQKYLVAYFLLGESLVTLIESTSPDGFIAKFVEERGEGIQHLGIEVDDLEATIAALEAQGVRVSNKLLEGPVRKEALVGPRSGFGHVWQLIEWLGPLRQASIEERVRAYGG